MATAENPTTVQLKLPRDARSQGFGLIACRSPRAIASVSASSDASMLSASVECTCPLPGRLEKLASVIVSMTHPPMVNARINRPNSAVEKFRYFS